ncbi:EcoAI/FtnUII family type I restriction enzme subunit R [Niallia circulans]|uniref:EcoAI/FtnUII family type I restriction enzme subunit R n=1 Tax=Niallia circulans TaxID=1397 RepID=UPI001F3C5D2D|nr:DEAD/DEAH box helicase family protein [Niallia circulans]MCF2649688.1 DEAD/DEAH box helicase family protein [Niallia circulans]
MDKKKLSERDICTKFITPAIAQRGWDIQRQIREEYTFTDGQVIVRGNLTSRGKKKRADYLLFYQPNLPIAVIEAKDNNHRINSGIQQAIDYGITLNVPFVYSSNGDGFVEHDFLTGEERTLGLDEFPSSEELWNRYKQAKDINEEQEQLITEPYYFAEGDKTPRYYQMNAINKTVEAIAKEQDRILLVMATGTGKTYTAFQIVHRLWKAKKMKKVLYLADRNILIDQTIQGDFRPFGNVMTKIEHREMDSSYQIYLALYQQLSGANPEMDIFRQFSPEFFDLIIVDECHRGSAKEESNWRSILNYFESAVQIGLTATPVERKDVSNIHYFGKPIYTYSLKQGIADGFLAPYKVVRVGIDRDLEGYRPEKGKLDRYGQVIEDREYYQSDFDRDLILQRRTELVAKKVTEFLKKTDRLSKTIVFCIDTPHAERMREALINENKDMVAKHPKYIMQITGDNKEGKAELYHFIDEEEPFPTVVTTSKLLTTGVDCKTCKVIVLDNIFGEHGMTEFKQIIGRGTRLKPEYGKEYFTVLDFRNASRLFADDEFDAPPIQIYEPGEGDDIVPPPPPEEENGPDVQPGEEDDDKGKPKGGGFTFGGENGGESPKGRTRFYVDDVEVRILNERVMYYDQDGKLITESLKDYSKKGILKEFSSIDDFINRWTETDKKEAIFEELLERGVLLDALKEEIGKEDWDEFDLICHIAFDKKPLTRSERAKNVKKKDYLLKYSGVAREVLEAILEKYQDEGRFDFQDVQVLEFQPFDKYGNPMKIAKAFGGRKGYVKAMKELERNLYA